MARCHALLAPSGELGKGVAQQIKGAPCKNSSGNGPPRFFLLVFCISGHKRHEYQDIETGFRHKEGGPGDTVHAALRDVVTEKGYNAHDEAQEEEQDGQAVNANHQLDNNGCQQQQQAARGKGHDFVYVFCHIALSFYCFLENKFMD